MKEVPRKPAIPEPDGIVADDRTKIRCRKNTSENVHPIGLSKWKSVAAGRVLDQHHRTNNSAEGEVSDFGVVDPYGEYVFA